MPQRRPHANVVIHSPQWDAEETVTLLPTKTFAAVLRAQGKALVIPPGVDRATLTQEAMETYLRPEEAALELLNEMIVAWTLCYEPTPEQQAAGAPGERIPLSRQAILALGEEAGAFITTEIDKLGGDVRPAGMSIAEFPGGTGPLGEGDHAAPVEPGGAGGGAGGLDH